MAGMKLTNEGKLVGILGTVIIHLIIGIIFMSFKISTVKKDLTKDILIEFAPANEPEIKEELINIPITSIEKILQDDEEMLNIARNLANKSEVKVDPADYIDKVKEELIKSGMLGLDNYIDEQKKLADEGSDDDEVPDVNKETKTKEPEDSQNMAANYQGPTRIYYNMEGRNHTYLPIPIYKCQGSGKVVLSIEINQKGIVENARIIEKESSTSDICLVETAIATALISRFNADLKAPRSQTGTLSYHFVAQ
jgi:hypothetical protein